MKFWRVDVADRLVPQVYIRFDLLSFHKHGGTNIVRVEDEHPPFSTSSRDYTVFVLNEATVVSESNLHALIDNLSHRH